MTRKAYHQSLQEVQEDVLEMSVLVSTAITGSLQALKERDQSIEDSALSSEGLAALIQLVDDGKTTAASARGLVGELVESGGDWASKIG